jgi:putative ABC transport system ATP-binding protein/lipoprotein-releasing system ATP-binding protein
MMGIVLRNVTKAFGYPPLPVLRNISLTIEDGEFVSLTGRSGSGKSTLLYILSTLDRPTSGEVLMGGQNVPALSAPELHRFRNERMGFVFQFHYLLPELNALENVLMPARKTRQEGSRRPYAVELLTGFGLGSKLESLPRQLSGGEAQRVAVARALLMQPRYIFADEPTGNLDSANGEMVVRIFQEINRTRGTTLIMVTHDADFAAMAGRQIVLRDGRILGQSPDAA